jgi:hypothetical protein
MSFCPRCVQPVPPDSSNCPHCNYDVASADSAPAAAPDSLPASVSAAPAPPLPLIGTWDDDEDVAPTRTNPGPARLAITWPSPSWVQWRSRLPIVVAAVAVAIAGVIIVIRPGEHTTVVAMNGAGSPAKVSSSQLDQKPQTGQQQAAVIDGYLKLSATARSGVSDAIVAIGNCHNIADAVTTLNKAADTRAGILAHLTAAQVSALPGGTGLLANLQQALQASATADRDYAAWGAATATSCIGKAAPTTTYTAAQQSDTVATAAKQRFVQSWNTVAAAFGLPPENASTF